jgi:hypothetical protein
MDRLSLPQRIVLVIAAGVACTAVGCYFTVTGRPASAGWYAYAPFGSGALTYSGKALTGWQLLLIWLGLVAGWALASLWVLRPSMVDRDGTG